jgi:hypothetical protein
MTRLRVKLLARRLDLADDEEIRERFYRRLLAMPGRTNAARRLIATIAALQMHAPEIAARYLDDDPPNRSTA